MSQAVFCASGSGDATGLDGLSPAGAAGLPLTQGAMKRDAVTTALCQPTDGHQIWQVCRLPWQGPCCIDNFQFDVILAMHQGVPLAASYMKRIETGTLHRVICKQDDA